MSYKDKEKEKRNKQKWVKNNPNKVKEIYKRWREKNIEKEKIRYKKYAKENSEHLKKYRQENKEKRKIQQRKYEKRRRKIDPKFRLDRNMASKISISLKGKKAGRAWEKLVGYSIENLIKHLEKQFDNKMSWDNYGSWHLDHIKPKSLFKYKTAEDSEFKQCWALKNLQPLEKIANIRKKNHYSV